MKKIKSYSQFVTEASGSENLLKLSGSALMNMFGGDFDLFKAIGIRDFDARKGLANPKVVSSIGKDSNKFIPLDVKLTSGFEAYAKAAQKWINKKNPKSPIKGSMLATGAKRAYEKYGVFVPLELALAQLTLEGGLSTDMNSKPLRTMNPFNVGNVDSGASKKHNDWQSGIDAYYDLMAKNYIVPSKGRTAESLLKNFVNVENKRYASDKNYETKLSALIDDIKKA